MQIGPYKISTFNFGFLKLDGGAMFGSVPKLLWNKLIEADANNRIRLATRSLLLESTDKKILIDVGCGRKWNEKSQKIFEFEHSDQNTWPFKTDDITDIILTHLHFDHAGGISHISNDSKLEPTFPNSKLYVQKINFENALNPTAKEKASYLEENYSIVREGNTTFTNGTEEVLPGITVHRKDGHTIGQQIVEVADSKHTLIFPTDLMPTSHHIPLAYHMGYDTCATTVLKEKEELLENIVAKDAIVVFQHDPVFKAGKLTRDLKGRFCLKEKINL